MNYGEALARARDGATIGLPDGAAFVCVSRGGHYYVEPRAGENVRDISEQDVLADDWQIVKPAKDPTP